MNAKEAIPMTQRQPWAEVLTLGDARFGILVGGPFDGRCYPLPDGVTPPEIDVSGLAGADPPRTVRYVLRDGLYRHQATTDARSAA